MNFQTLLTSIEKNKSVSSIVVAASLLSCLQNYPRKIETAFWVTFLALRIMRLEALEVEMGSSNGPKTKSQSLTDST